MISKPPHFDQVSITTLSAACSKLVGMCRQHALAATIVNETGQQARRRRRGLHRPLNSVRRQSVLHLIPKHFVDDGIVLPKMDAVTLMLIVRRAFGRDLRELAGFHISDPGSLLHASNRLKLGQNVGASELSGLASSHNRHSVALRQFKHFKRASA